MVDAPDHVGERLVVDARTCRRPFAGLDQIEVRSGTALCETVTERPLKPMSTRPTIEPASQRAMKHLKGARSLSGSFQPRAVAFRAG
jgi:hypothetical protein